MLPRSSRYPNRRPRRASIDSSSTLSDPPSDLDDREDPFLSSPTQTSTSAGRAPITNASAVFHKPLPGTGAAIANKRVKYEGELLESPQTIWERRFKNAPPTAPKTERERDQIFFRRIVNDCKDDAHEERSKFLLSSTEKDDKIGQLKATIEGLESNLKELMELKAELLKENKILTEARDVAREGNADRNKQIEGLRKTLREKLGASSNNTSNDDEV